MNSYRFTKVLLALAILASVPALAAEIPPVPRIMIAGDSWAHFIFLDLTFPQVLEERGLDEFSEDNMALGGTKASQWASPSQIQGHRNLLLAQPSIDIVFLTLGGNDFMYGEYDVDGDGDLEGFSYTNHPGMTDDEFLDWIADNVATVVQSLTEVRPNIRVALCGYDYMNALKKTVTYPETVCTLTPEDALFRVNFVNELMGECEVRIKDRVKNIPRAQFINSYGVMQYYLGYPGTVVPDYISGTWEGECKYDPRWDGDGTDAFRFGPGEVPLPGQAPDYDPWFGGDSTYKKSPWLAMLYYQGDWDHYGLPPDLIGGISAAPIDDWIHLSAIGHHALVDHCFEVCIEDWLRNPLGPPMVLQTATADDLPDVNRNVRFRVMFNKPVTGVDPTDFDLNGGGAKNSEVVNVTPMEPLKDAFSQQYMVTVTVGTTAGNLVLNVIDDDTIVDETGAKLGGNGGGNGNFVSDLPFTVPPNFEVPVAAWPAAVLLLALGGFTVRRRKH